VTITYQPKNILVTGGAGFIGGHFLCYMHKTHPTVHLVNVDKLTYAGSLNHLKEIATSNRYHFIQGDICDATLLKQLMTHYHIDTIVHFAAESHVDRSIHSPHAFMETNVMGTFQLLEAAKTYWFDAKKEASQCRFHHIGTDEVFGSLAPHQAGFTEETAYQPRSPYSASKAASDHLVMAYFHTYGLPITLSNCSNNYGPHQHSEKFIPTIINACLKKEMIPVYGNGQNKRDWLYVEDHCRAIDTILRHAPVGSRYNIGGCNEWENIHLAKYICEKMDKQLPFEGSYLDLLRFVTDRPGHDFRYAIDEKKIRNELQWAPLETFETGILKTIASIMNTTTPL
jgi:dTDP-glucose 4,6-dehydratase